jgi:glucosamine 6-phosphate synthetase-like amidotransferase/phosphosugar isomerase protein
LAGGTGIGHTRWAIHGSNLASHSSRVGALQ